MKLKKTETEKVQIVTKNNACKKREVPCFVAKINKKNQPPPCR